VRGRDPPLRLGAVGELIGKITSLEIKGVRLADPHALADVGKELAVLRATAATALACFVDRLCRLSVENGTPILRVGASIHLSIAGTNIGRASRLEHRSPSAAIS
jgi:hypothetical protein